MFKNQEVANAQNELNTKKSQNDSLRKLILTKDSVIYIYKDKDSVIPKETTVDKTKKEYHSATWYNMHGSRTYSGEKFHKDSMTAAYNFAKMGTYLKITNIYNDKSVIVKVNDKMGVKSKNRIDLSKIAFNQIANSSNGRAKVKVEKI